MKKISMLLLTALMAASLQAAPDSKPKPKPTSPSNPSPKEAAENWLTYRASQSTSMPELARLLKLGAKPRCDAIIDAICSDPSALETEEIFSYAYACMNKYKYNIPCDKNTLAFVNKLFALKYLFTLAQINFIGDTKIRNHITKDTCSDCNLAIDLMYASILAQEEQSRVQN